MRYARATRITTLLLLGAAAALIPAAAPRGDSDIRAAAAATSRRGGVRLGVSLHFEAARYAVGAEFDVPPGTDLTAVMHVRGPGPVRTLLLQAVSHGRWRTVTAGRTRRDGSLTVRLRHGSLAARSVYRAFAPATGRGPAKRSRRHAVRVIKDLPVVAVPTAPGVPSGLLGPADAWTLMPTSDAGDPAYRWNPCTPIRYRVHLYQSPPTPTFGADLTEAIRRLSVATGLTFVDAGSTDYRVDFSGRTQAAWPADTDLVIAVSPEAQTPELAGGLIGWTQIDRARRTSTAVVIEQVEMVVEQEWLATRGSDFDSSRGPVGGELLLHELGHAVGLGHTVNADQVMYPSLQGTADFQLGDRAGLAYVGARDGSCLT